MFEFSALIKPVLAIGGLGLLFGALLAIAARFFSVAGDPRIDEIRECLPGANCGSCGFAGCDGLAKAIVESGAPINSCTVANAQALEKIADIMGVEAGDFKPLQAVVCCLSNTQNAHIKFKYQGLQDCRAVAALDEGQKMCKFSCLGFGNCTRVCPTGAISIVSGLAKVDADKCIACGKCASECPRGIISLLPKDRNVTVTCRNHYRGKDVRDSCEAGCIGCGLCAKTCKFGAITLQDNLPVIDYDKCTGCMQCAQKCPRHCIDMDLENKRVAFINEDLCIGCSRCAKNCKFEAISGEIKGKFTVDPEKCGNCGQCESLCPKGAITMIK